MDRPGTWQPGDLVAARYRLERCIGSGSAAEVWRAQDQNLRAEVAVKLLHPRLAESEVARRFLREARAAAQLRSLHVVQVLDHGTSERGAPYIAMELLEGETLEARIERDGRQPSRVVARILSHVAKAAAKAHARGIIHRDLKPENMFLVRDDDAEITKVIDFGIAKITGPISEISTSITASRVLIGTPQYMSPEQASFGAVDYRTDLYAMGIVAFECMTGHLPFDTDDMMEVLEAARVGRLLPPSHFAPVPEAFDGWFAQATHVDPAARFPSARDVATSLQQALGVEDVE